eukprot:CAMPEP_0203751972 /NCGR_PEP_ID=MMETSP0098-20131031/5966_1 /ASSEMBLY_ACC=CAM_ASM_000208 /TAXON_ID=96639 /ORGANISM=" , Strain NY0313808BC1" /LENGTH=172 /DNA_ID=CAMNT_0050641941 /DNA_START=60 /DNA_END=575 /DNA_ORIENTATION=+
MKVSSVAAVLFAMSSPVLASRPFVCYLGNPESSCSEFSAKKIKDALPENKTMCLSNGDACNMWATSNIMYTCPSQKVSVYYAAAPPCGSNKVISQFEKEPEKQFCVLEDPSVGCPRDTNSYILPKFGFGPQKTISICHKCASIPKSEHGKLFCKDERKEMFDADSENATTCK